MSKNLSKEQGASSKQLKITDLYDTTISLYPIDLFTPNPWNVNEMTEEEFEHLKESIQITKGKYLRENPIEFRKNGTLGKLEIVDGEHRWKACIELGIEKIPARPIEIDTDKAQKLNVIYSMNRGHINYFKFSKLLNKYYETHKITQDDLAKEFGLGSQSTISDILPIYQRLSPYIEKIYRHAGKVTNRILTTIARCKNDYFREKLINKTIQDKWKSKQIRRHATDLNSFYEYAIKREIDPKIIQEIFETLLTKIGLDFVSWDLSSMKDQFNLIHQEFSEKKFILGDCIDLIPTLNYEFDCILADPPFSLSASGYEVKLEGRKNFNTDFGEWDFFETEKEFIDFSRRWIEVAKNKLKTGGALLLFTKIESIESIKQILEENGFKYRTTISWHKTNPGPSPGKQYANSMEYLIYSTKGDTQKTFNMMGQNPLHNFLESSICMGNERKEGKHSTQKPLKIIERLLEIHTNTKDYVLDPFAGSGTTGIACYNKKRNFVLIEKDEKYFEIAKIRFRDIKKGGKPNNE